MTSSVRARRIGRLRRRWSDISLVPIFIDTELRGSVVVAAGDVGGRNSCQKRRQSVQGLPLHR